MLPDDARVALTMRQCFDDAVAVIAKHVIELRGVPLCDVEPCPEWGSNPRPTD